MGKVIYHKLTVTTKRNEDGGLVHTVETTEGIGEEIISAQKRFNESAYTAAEKRAKDSGQVVGDFIGGLEYLTG